MTVSTFKKWLAVFLCIALLICGVPFSASAEEGEITLSLNTYTSTDSNINQTKAANVNKALIESINTQLKNFETYVDISKFKLSFTDENQQKIVNILSGELPECFHIALEFSISYNKGYITAITPTYIYTKAEYESMLAECEAVADEMLKDIKGNSSLTDVEKLLLLHDRIALHCEYDYERNEMGMLPFISHSMYGVFVNKIAVCQGYALAYAYLLDQIGIENYYCSSELLYHAWNIVYVNNKPYHVDITWDDPNWDVTGEVLHTNFLVSTQEHINNGHYVIDENGYVLYDYDDSPVDTTYDDYFWEDSETAFTLLNNEIYYIDGKDGQTVAIKRYSDNEIIYTTTHNWDAGDGNYWSGNYAKLDTDGVNLLFSLGDGIYKLNVKTGEATEIYKPELQNGFAIYGFTYDDGMLIYEINDYPYFDVNTKKLYQYKVPYLPYMPGDIDDNSAVDLVDVNVIAQVIAGWSVKYNKLTLDVNGDGYENLKDLVHLARFVAGWQGIELY